MKLIFATQNQHKFNEVQQAIGNTVKLVSLKDLHFFEELPETHVTLKENAFEKAEFIFKRFMADCFSEDTGLEVEALNNEPGVFSARYAGEKKKSEDNIQLLLRKMHGMQNRNARFRTVICLIKESQKHFFEGIINGRIIEANQGNSGFGYDPVFIPEGMNMTFAEMSLAEKNALSHRAKAISAMKHFLKLNG
ncbi:MAG: RdgB/HAM1 family non-canonical purine NTP pyrophosphatase [Chitinophagales bacterium]|nr:RdgB/HAM1 family non-canonical purine NTP pyrophosphatase [Chitinophagales bacterium]